jgi:hypothetical protein
VPGAYELTLKLNRASVKFVLQFRKRVVPEEVVVAKPDPEFNSVIFEVGVTLTTIVNDEELDVPLGFWTNNVAVVEGEVIVL